MINSFRTPPGTIVVEDINKVFFLTKPGKKDCEFHALKDISLRIGSGECVGIIGRNGSGKSTLLKIIAGILQPTGGKVNVNGTVMPFIELGVGFDEELTGRENVFLYGSLLGIRRDKIEREFNNIVELSQLEDFIDTPLKKYSSGMRVRLAFSTAVVNDFDIILIDEILAVGDELFQKKSRDKIKEMKLKGKTIVVVSHSMEDIQDICDRAVLLEHGKIICRGDAEDVVNYYRGITTKKDYRRLRTAIKNKVKKLKGLESLSEVPSQKENGGLNRLFSFLKKSGGKPDIQQRIEAARTELLSLIKEMETVIGLRERIIKEKINSNLAESARTRERLRVVTKYGDNYTQLRKKQDLISAQLDTDEREFKLLGREHSEILLMRLRYTGKLKEKIGSRRELIHTLSSQIAESEDDNKKREYISTLISLIIFELNSTTDPEQLVELLNSYYTWCIVPFVRTIGGEDRRTCVREFVNMCAQILFKSTNSKTRTTVLDCVIYLINEGLMYVGDSSLIIWTILEINERYTSIIGKQPEQKQTDVFGDILRRLLFKNEKELLAVKVDSRNINLSNKESSIKILRRKKKLESEIEMIKQALIDIYMGNCVSENYPGKGCKKGGWGFGDVIIEDVKFYDSNGNLTKNFVTDGYFRATIFFSAKKKVESPIFGIAIYTEEGINVAGPNTTTSDFQIDEIDGKGCLSFVIENLPLMEGRYELSAAVYDSKTYLPHDHQHRIYCFTVVTESQMKGGGLVKIPHKWEFSVIEKKFSVIEKKVRSKE